ncbi:hypothetical protein GCT13_27795 [Paraburkholderia sp. CNPSo 3157]|uniref:Transposase n=1 Tax=Paraburkholderia franconis TaxID=2654983 RepID=A0A7X1TIK9_9BURK|nr:hypothetical protein [Paraburkholderia franconis]
MQTWSAMAKQPISRWRLRITGRHSRLPDESTITRFRHRLEAHGFSSGMVATVNGMLQARNRAQDGLSGKLYFKQN